MKQCYFLPHPCTSRMPASLTLWKILLRALATKGYNTDRLFTNTKLWKPQIPQNPNVGRQLYFPQLKGRQLMESLPKDFSIKHLSSCDPFLLLIQLRRFSQSCATAQGGSQSKAGQGGLAGGLAIGHITHITEKAKAGNESLGSKRSHSGR